MINNMIIPECESTFPAYIPADRVVAQHIAKYLSFDGEYKDVFLYKYGLTPEYYTLFRKAILASKPHTPLRWWVKQLLAEYLCAYFETKLVDEANLIAQQKGGVLIYCDQYGKLASNLINKDNQCVLPRSQPDQWNEVTNLRLQRKNEGRGGKEICLCYVGAIIMMLLFPTILKERQELYIQRNHLCC